MAAAQKAQPFPRSGAWIDGNGMPTPAFFGYMFALDQNIIGPLTNAVNDAAAATAGVSINGLYRNGSVVMIRVV